MAQGSRSSRPKTTCCRCRRRAEGVSRLTNLGWLCDPCYELLNRSDLGRRLYRMVYQFSGREAGVSPLARRTLARAGTPAGRATAAPEGERAIGTTRDEERAEALVA
jgi:hypothetical protein